MWREKEREATQKSGRELRRLTQLVTIDAACGLRKGRGEINFIASGFIEMHFHLQSVELAMLGA